MSYNAILDGHTVKPIEDVLEWARWFETADRTVKKTTVYDYDISTVFLGIDHGFGFGKPLWFETMVFNCDKPGTVDMDRYETWEEAERGHDRLVRKWRKIK